MHLVHVQMLDACRHRHKSICVGVGARLLDVVGESTPLQDAFLLADDVLRQVWVHACQGARVHLHPCLQA